MARYSWMIVISVIGAIALMAFFAFLFGDMERIKGLNKKKTNYLLNISLLVITAICITLAIYLFFDIQEQVRLLDTVS